MNFWDENIILKKAKVKKQLNILIDIYINSFNFLILYYKYNININVI